MRIFRTMRAICLCSLIAIWAAAPVTAQETADGLLAEARTLYAGPDTSLAALRDIRALLDRIIEEFPASDLAVRILLAEPIEGLDVAAIDARLADVPTETAEPPAPTGSDQVTPGEAERAALLPSFPAPPEPGAQPADATSEAELDLGPQEVRTLQARLLVLGFDPNGIDGRIGPGTRGALSAWQGSAGLPATGYLSADQRAALQRQSDPALTAWLQTPENARLMTPPPPIALGPGNMTGTWRFTSNCGANSRLGRLKITGALTVRHDGGNRYSGPARQSQGFNGRFSGQLNGRQLVGEINWGLLVGRTTFRGRIADQRLALSGRDSNRCAFSAYKAG